MMIFMKILAETESAKHLEKLFGYSKLVTFIDTDMLKQPPLGNWSTMGAQLNISSFHTIVG